MQGPPPRCAHRMASLCPNNGRLSSLKILWTLRALVTELQVHLHEDVVLYGGRLYCRNAAHHREGDKWRGQRRLDMPMPRVQPFSTLFCRLETSGSLTATTAPCCSGGADSHACSPANTLDLPVLDMHKCESTVPDYVLESFHTTSSLGDCQCITLLRVCSKSIVVVVVDRPCC
jgi:hypothetical protein